MGFRKSSSCAGRATGAPLTEYDTFEEAQDDALYMSAVHPSDFVPYRCDRCGLYHLSPTGRRTPSTTCPVCTGADGKPKKAYETQEDAERRADILREERGVFLRVYACDHGHGWHLTKR